jgi:flap endonuclease GEN
MHPPNLLRLQRNLLNDEGVVESIDAADTDDPNAHPLIRAAVDGTVLAVDISEWIFQATSQPATAEHFSPKGQVAKLVFDRAVNWLRMGCIPIGVIDGRPPAEKLKRMKQRYAGYVASGGGGSGGQFRALGDVALRVLRLLGLPAVEAPGEVREGVGCWGFSV